MKSLFLSPGIITEAQFETSRTRHVLHNVVEGDITFVGRGNPSPSKYYIVPQNLDVAEFLDSFIANRDIPTPQVIISVTGGAQDFKMPSSTLEQIFNRGLLRAAEDTSAWIITGGLSSGVMEFVGNAMRQTDIKIPCIGVATYCKVSNNDLLEGGGKVNYSAEKRNDNNSASLQQDHTHFVLVKGTGNDWGQEIEFRTALECHFANKKDEIPVVLVALNGGLYTIKTLVEGSRMGFPIIIVDKSGRACDAMASYLKHRLDNKRHKLDAWNSLIESIREPQRREYNDLMKELAQYDQITIFNPAENAAEDMDKVILRSIMKMKENTKSKSSSMRLEGNNFYLKMKLAVQWGRADMIEELLQDEDSDAKTQQKTDAINICLQKALLLNKPEIYELLVKKGADKDSINLAELYNHPDIKFHVDRLKPHAGISSRDRVGRGSTHIEVSEYSPLMENSMRTLANIPNVNMDSAMDIARKVLRSIDEIYQGLLDDKQVTFTDALVWAIVVDRHELAKAIWRNMEFPIHAALLACHLYSILVEWFPGEEGYQQCRDWFEAEAIAVLSEADYDHAIPILKWKWQELRNYDALRLAELGNCKEFTSHSYVQRYLNMKLYFDAHGHVAPGTPMWKILVLVCCPALIPIMNTYEYEEHPKRPTRFYHFYKLPVVKMVSTTVCYILFLALLTLNVMECAPEKYEISWYEIFLWIWVFAQMLEELVQYFEDRDNYFDALSNQMDLFMNAGLVAYFILRIIAWVERENGYVEAYTDVLIISNIMCYVRLMNVFAVSKSLGPLFFVIIRLFKDIVQWAFIFVVFMVSFQIGIFALTRQAHEDPWVLYPTGTFGVGFSTIIGQQGENTMEYLQRTEIGVVLLSIYALISQIMLVNLLIAMFGNTYSTVKTNSDKEWKFYRYGLITEFISTSPYPPPFNLVVGPIFYIKHWLYPDELDIERQYDTTILHMKIAKDKTIEKEKAIERDALPALSYFIRESTRKTISQSDGDRLVLEYNMKTLHGCVEETKKQTSEQMTDMRNQMKEMMEMQKQMITTIETQRESIKILQDSLNSQERAFESLHNKLDALEARKER